MGLRDRLRHLVRGPSRAPGDGASTPSITSSAAFSPARAGPAAPAPRGAPAPGAREVHADDGGRGPVHVVGADAELAAATAELYAARGEVASWSVRE